MIEDEEFGDLPSQVWDVVAIAGILFGILLSFQGKSMLRLALVFFALFAGCVVTAAVVSWADQGANEGEDTIDPSIWLALVLFGGVAASALVHHVLFLAKTVVCLALTLCLTGLFNQYAVANIPQYQNEAAISALATFLLASLVLVYVTYDMALVYCTSLMGGLLTLLGVGRLVRGPVSPKGMWINPEILLACEDWACWSPLAIGVLVCFGGLAYQLHFSHRRGGGVVATEIHHHHHQPLLQQQE